MKLGKNIHTSKKLSLATGYPEEEKNKGILGINIHLHTTVDIVDVQVDCGYKIIFSYKGFQLIFESHLNVVFDPFREPAHKST